MRALIIAALCLPLSRSAPQAPTELSPGLYSYPGLMSTEFEQEVLVPLWEGIETDYELVVAVAPLPDAHGITTTTEDGRLLILIRPACNAIVMDTLIHELAHVLTWDCPGDPHGSYWGVAYSEVYRLSLTLGEDEE